MVMYGLVGGWEGRIYIGNQCYCAGDQIRREVHERGSYQMSKHYYFHILRSMLHLRPHNQYGIAVEVLL